MTSPNKSQKSPSNSLDGVQKWWRGQSQNNKLLIGGGAGLVLLVVIAAIASGGGGNNPGYNPYGQGYAGQAYQGQGDQGQGYANYGYQGQPGAAPNGAGPADGDDPTGYWARQRSQEQSARSYDDYIRDNNTVRNNQTGEVTTDVPNTYADPAIQSGDYSQVPTPELPTTTPAPAAETPAPAE